MECTICFNKMTGSSESIFTTLCGHLFHEKCLKGWIQTQSSSQECPQCRKPVSQNNILQVFLDIEQSGVNEQLILTRIADINIDLEKRDKKNSEFFSQLMDSLEKITMSISSFEYQNDMLRKENGEMKQLIKGLQSENKLFTSSRKETSSIKEEMKAKDLMISNLQKEVNDLKLQRDETTRELKSVQQQINLLKTAAKGENKRDPLKDINERGQPLTLKFDSFSDKLIVE